MREGEHVIGEYVEERGEGNDVVEIAGVEEFSCEETHGELEEELSGAYPSYCTWRVGGQKDTDIVVLVDSVGVCHAECREQDTPAREIC